MDKIRYVVAMIRRDPPAKPEQEEQQWLRAEIPLEDYPNFILDALVVPKKKKWWHRGPSDEQIRKALREAIRIGKSRAYSHLMNSRWKHGRLSS